MSCYITPLFNSTKNEAYTPFSWHQTTNTCSQVELRKPSLEKDLQRQQPGKNYVFSAGWDSVLRTLVTSNDLKKMSKATVKGAVAK